jgi:methylated-DNA-[protein]-cysteine S-methyltransferase
MNLYTAKYESPFGDLIAVVDETGTLVRLILPNEHDRWQIEIARNQHTTVLDAKRNSAVLTQLDEYFNQKRRTFDLPLRTGGTSFQQTVWSSLTTILYGTTITYKELAERIGNPAAVRAVGRANGTNPIPIVIPCHRVIGADGSLTGFGGGLELKESLLRLEGAPLQLQREPVQQLSLL